MKTVALPTRLKLSESANFNGCVFTTALVSLNIPEGVLFIDSVKRLKNDRCFHE